MNKRVQSVGYNSF